MTKNVDCEYMCNESHDCCHPDRSKGWRKLWHLSCVEEVIKDITCDLKKNLWDMLEVDDAKYKKVSSQGTVPNKPSRPPPPPPPTRVYKNDKRISADEDEDDFEKIKPGKKWPRH